MLFSKNVSYCTCLFVKFTNADRSSTFYEMYGNKKIFNCSLLVTKLRLFAKPSSVND